MGAGVPRGIGIRASLLSQSAEQWTQKMPHPGRLVGIKEPRFHRRMHVHTHEKSISPQIHGQSGQDTQRRQEHPIPTPARTCTRTCTPADKTGLPMLPQPLGAACSTRVRSSSDMSQLIRHVACLLGAFRSGHWAHLLLVAGGKTWEATSPIPRS